MSAGLVAWKLCDRGLDCEGCPFDAAMRGAAVVSHPASGERLAGAAALPAPQDSFPGDRRYHRCHGWAQVRQDGGVRLGLDAFAARLAGHPEAVILPAPGCGLRRGEAACWLAGHGELLAVRAPVTGTVRRCNPRLHGEPGLVADDPCGEGWLLEVTCGGSEAQLAALLDAPAASRFARDQERRLALAVAPAAAAVGSALPDGGEPLRDLRRVVGERRWHRLLKAVLG
jgi:glycine cleavage system H protein